MSYVDSVKLVLLEVQMRGLLMITGTLAGIFWILAVTTYFFPDNAWSMLWVYLFAALAGLLTLLWLSILALLRNWTPNIKPKSK